MITSYKELTVWQKSIDLIEEIYRVTKAYPPEERFGLISQTRRAVVSIPANIAEGYGRKHRQEYIQFIRIAFASGAELETLIVIANRLKLVKSDLLQKADLLLNEIMKMLNKLINSLVAKP